MKPQPLEYDVGTAFCAEYGRCVTISATYAGGLAFSQQWMSPAMARSLGRDLLDAAARVEAAERAAARQVEATP